MNGCVRCRVVLSRVGSCRVVPLLCGHVRLNQQSRSKLHTCWGMKPGQPWHPSDVTATGLVTIATGVSDVIVEGSDVITGLVTS